MLVEPLANNLSNYRFPEKEGYIYGFNLYALRDGRNVMLIDAAFRTQAKQVSKALAAEGLKLTHVLLTHFHPDHVSGLSVLDPDTTVLGSPRYTETLTKEIPQKITPVSFTKPFRFGDFSLSFFPAQGHSACSIYIDINGEFLHVGDNIMARYDGKAILPWVEFERISEHISSLKKLKSMRRTQLLLSHGPMLSGIQQTERAVNDRLSYLEKVLETSARCDYDEAVGGASCEFVGEEFFYQLQKVAAQRSGV